MGNQPLTRLRQIDRKAMNANADRLFARLGVHIDPTRPARGLSIADQQLVEIAKALSSEARILIMDEPTAALSGVEVERLFAVVRSLRDEGAAIMFISHRFEEITALCERVTIMRDGRHVCTELVADLTVDDMIRRMVGRDLSALFPKQDVEPGEVLLEVDGLSREGVFRDISFSVRAGEIVALAGLVGAGRSEVMQAVFGVDPYDSGTVTFLRQAAEARLAARRDGRRDGAGPRGPPPAGPGHGAVDRAQRDPAPRPQARPARAAARQRASATRRGSGPKRLQTKFGRLSDAVGTLSGGNQQKVVLAKWLSTGPKLLIVDEPTRGIDVGTKAEVHRLMSSLAADGLAIVMVSSELPEVLGMADRIVVLREGRVAAQLTRAEATEESVMYAAMGQRGGVGDDREPEALAGGLGGRRLRPRTKPRPSSARARVLRTRELGIVLALAALVIYTAVEQPPVPLRAEHPRHPAQHRDPRGDGGRSGRRGDHPQHRPVGRLGARPQRLHGRPP